MAGKKRSQPPPVAEEQELSDLNEVSEDSLGDLDGSEDLEGDFDEDGIVSDGSDSEGLDDDNDAEENDKGRNAAHKKAASASGVLPEDDLLAAQMPAATDADATLLQLEVNALLAEVRVNYGACSATVEREVTRLCKALACMAPRQADASHATAFINSLGLGGACSQAVAFEVQPPASVTMVGSWATKTAAKPSVCLDVAVEIPEQCLFKKAHLNHRYHARRGLFLAAVAEHLQAQPAFKGRKLEVGSLEGDPTRPTLLIHPPQPSKSSGSGASAASGSEQQILIRLLPCFAPGALALEKLGPERNSVRSVCKPSAGAPVEQKEGRPAKQQKTAAGKAAGAAADADAAGTDQLLPTAAYNSGVCREGLMLVHHALLLRAFKAAPHLHDALLLLKVWARQQGVYDGPGGLGGHLLAMLLAHLSEQGKLPKVMSPLQAFRAALVLLADATSGLSKGIAMGRPEVSSLQAAAAAAFAAAAPAAGGAGGAAAAAAAAQRLLQGLPPASKAPALAMFKKHQAVVMVDPTGWCNLAAHVSKSCMVQVQLCAQQTLKLLDRPVDADEAFAAAFLTPSSPTTAYDYHWRVVLQRGPEQAQGAGESSSAERALWRESTLKLESTVKQALGDRAKLVRAVSRAHAPCSPQAFFRAQASGTDADVPAAHGVEVLVVARLDPTNALRLVDIGPAADDAKGAAKFRAFWGDKSELRRFQDGKICEAVVWEVGQGERHTIPDKVVEYAVLRHFGPSTCVHGCSGSLDAALADGAFPEPSGAAAAAAAHGKKGGGKGAAPGGAVRGANEAVAASRMLQGALDKLSKQLRNLNDMALKVVAVQPLSASARGTSPFTPVPHPLAGGPGADDLEAWVAGGGRLPRCMEPVEVLVQLEGSGRWPSDPAAFMKTKAAMGLQLAGCMAKTYGHVTVCSEAAVDVLFEGFAFRLIIYSGRDEAALTKALAAPSQQQQLPAAAATAAAAGGLSASQLVEANPTMRSWHHGLISGIAGVNPAFAPAVRLAQRWLSCHMLTNHFTHEAVELLVAAAFSPGHSVQPQPGSRVTGFLRFLTLLARHPWSARPLVVDPQAQLKPQQRRDILRAFSARKAAGTAAALYLCTPHDLESTHWSQQQPSGEVLQHAAALAAKSAALLTALVERGSTGTAAGGATPAGWLQAFSVALEEFDALLLLRLEALPQADRGFASPHELVGRHKRQAQPDCLAEVVEGAGPDAPPKHARAFLSGFPLKAIASKGPDALRAELLVGFDPLEPLLSALNERFGHLATFCVNALGGPVVGIKWKAAAFLPAPTKVMTAHTALACNATGLVAPSAAAGSGAAGRPSIASVPNVAHMLAEMRRIGEGLVEDVVMPGGCWRLAPKQ